MRQETRSLFTLALITGIAMVMLLSFGVRAITSVQKLEVATLASGYTAPAVIAKEISD